MEGLISTLANKQSNNQEIMGNLICTRETNDNFKHTPWKSAKEVGEKLRIFLYKMPSVFYDGPNGKKTKGYLLYSFTKSERFEDSLCLSC
uniref:Uncharacterized protein n=1 Tax=Solanum lycopersicum TaxID=4081 RepID=K4AW82_SOLLC